MSTIATIINAASAGADADSGAYNPAFEQFAIQITATGSPVGTVSIYHGNDGSNWAKLPVMDPISGAAVEDIDITAAGTIMVTVDSFFSEYVRAYYTRTSGSGTITVNIREPRP